MKVRKSIKLPEDIRAFTHKTVLKRAVPCVMLLIASVVFLLLCGERAFDTGKNISWRIFYYGVTIALPFMITGVPLKLIDRTYLGTVERVEIKSSVVLDNDRSIRVERRHWYSKNSVCLTILTHNGRRIERRVYEDNSSNVSQLERYREGDTVFHLYGSKEVVILPKAADTHVKCAVCGRVNGIGERYCGFCRQTLIKTPPSLT